MDNATTAPAALRSLARAAHRCRLAVTVDPVERELYGTARAVLDERATLRRVALLHRGTGRYTLTQLERDTALEIIRDRFDGR